MKVRLVRDSRINHKAGETVEVTPAERDFLVSLGSAVDAVKETAIPKDVETPEDIKKVTARKKK